MTTAASASKPVTKTRIERRLPLEQLLSRPLFYFDLEPILERAGQSMLRNPDRLQIVCEHCVRTLTQTDDVIFEGSGFYFIVTSCEEPQASQLASHVASALYKCFFGTDDAPPEALRALFRKPSREEISALAGDAQPVDAATAETVEGAQAHTPAQETVPAAKPDPVVELAVHGIHREEGFRFGFAPAYDLRSGRLSTLFCGTVRLHDQFLVEKRDSFETIGARELPRIDQAMLLKSIAFGKSLHDAGLVAAVGTSVSFETLAWSKGRQFYQNALRATASTDNALLIVKIDMIPAGTPPARLADLVAGIRPYCKRVFVHLPDDGLAMLQGSPPGAAGYVLSLRPGTTLHENSAISMRFAKLCAAHGALSCVAHVPDLATARRMRESGVRLGEGAFSGSKIYFDDTAVETITEHRPELRSFREYASAVSQSVARSR